MFFWFIDRWVGSPELMSIEKKIKDLQLFCVDPFQLVENHSFLMTI